MFRSSKKVGAAEIVVGGGGGARILPGIIPLFYGGGKGSKVGQRETIT